MNSLEQRTSMRLLGLAVVTSAVLIPLPILNAQEASVERIDLGALHEIKTQAFQHSEVMDNLFHLADVHGPRLTNSPNHRAAAEWAMQRLRSYGLQNVHLESWGEFGNAWQYKKFYGALVEPNYQPIVGAPLAWTAGTNGPVTGEVVLARIESEADFPKFAGKLRGKIVLFSKPEAIPMPTEVEARRFTDEELRQLTLVPDPGAMPSGFGGCQANPPATNISRRAFTPGFDVDAAVRRQAAQRVAINEFLKSEGVLVVVTNGRRAIGGGTVTTEAGGSQDPDTPETLPMVAIVHEHYNRLVRLIENGKSPKVTFDIETEFYKDDLNGFNVVGDIPGASKKNELVMLGAHLDSWQGGTGATDDGIGSAVVMDAVRILTRLDRPMDRTVRIALWGGEEQGLLGSKYYAKQHFGPERKDSRTKLVAYYNHDYGAGKYRGIWANGNDQIASIFKQWSVPLRDLDFQIVAGATAKPVKSPGGTDSASFSALGFNGFAFLQDPLQCAFRASHTNMDFSDRVPEGDAMQSAAIQAWFVFNTANRTAPLPVRSANSISEK